MYKKAEFVSEYREKEYFKRYFSECVYCKFLFIYLFIDFVNGFLARKGMFYSGVTQFLWLECCLKKSAVYLFASKKGH